MATYRMVTWQEDDEVTAEALQQMSDNIEIVRNESIKGKISYLKNDNGTGDPSVPFGRGLGTETATKIWGGYVAFNSQTPHTQYDVYVKYPENYFTKPPIVTATLAQGSGLMIEGIWVIDFSTSTVIFRVSRQDNNADIIRGALNVIALGL